MIIKSVTHLFETHITIWPGDFIFFFFARSGDGYFIFSEFFFHYITPPEDMLISVSMVTPSGSSNWNAHQGYH